MNPPVVSLFVVLAVTSTALAAPTKKPNVLFVVADDLGCADVGFHGCQDIPIIHLHDLHDPKYPYQLMVDLLAKARWEGYALLEMDGTPPDRVAAMIEQRQVWEAMIERASR